MLQVQIHVSILEESERCVICLLLKNDSRLHYKLQLHTSLLYDDCQYFIAIIEVIVVKLLSCLN